jgi:hypothetical protein
VNASSASAMASTAAALVGAWVQSLAIIGRRRPIFRSPSPTPVSLRTVSRPSPLRRRTITREAARPRAGSSDTDLGVDPAFHAQPKAAPRLREAQGFAGRDADHLLDKSSPVTSSVPGAPPAGGCSSPERKTHDGGRR